jgi:hypothetical protein
MLGLRYIQKRVYVPVTTVFRESKIRRLSYLFKAPLKFITLGTCREASFPSVGSIFASDTPALIEIVRAGGTSLVDLIFRLFYYEGIYIPHKLRSSCSYPSG